MCQEGVKNYFFYLFPVKFDLKLYNTEYTIQNTMDPIPAIDLNEYDLSYELQFTTFMLTLLEPYIRFDRKSEESQIYRKGGGTRLLIEEGISVKEYVYFIQYTFPNIINTEIRLLKEKILDERTNKDRLYQLHVAALSCKGRGKPVSETTLLIRSASARHLLRGRARPDDVSDDSLNELYEMFKDMSQGDIDEQKRYYDVGQNVGAVRSIPPPRTFLKDMYAHEERLEYLQSIKRINKEGNGRVKNVMIFLENLQYIYD